jgi:hypothetical protein
LIKADVSSAFFYVNYPTFVPFMSVFLAYLCSITITTVIERYSMKTLKTTLLYNWHLMRVLRLGLGIICAVQAIQMHDFLSGGIAGVLLFQALSNKGCCGPAGCAAPFTATEADENAPVHYEEIKKTET